MASPCTSTAGGSTSPHAVGSEQSSETRGVRRLLSAFCASALEVVTTKRPCSASKNGSVGQVIGVPSFARVLNSQVRTAWKTAMTSAGRLSGDIDTLHIALYLQKPRITK